MDSPITQFLDLPLWQKTDRGRLVPLGESAEVTRQLSGGYLFRQFHPADQFSLLVSGSVEHSSGGNSEARPMGKITWPWAALGWSGFLPPCRHGTTARAISDIELVSWRHEDLARVFYADPLLAVTFFRLVLDSVRRQFEWARSERLLAVPKAVDCDPLPSVQDITGEEAVLGNALTLLRRSSFFEVFSDRSLEQLAGASRILNVPGGTTLVDQDKATAGLLLLDTGKAIGYFSESNERGELFERFRSIPENGGILAGIPTIDGGYVAEARVVATSDCRFYSIPAAAIETMISEDPEFGRTFMQRQLARFSQLISLARPLKTSVDEECEIGAIESVLDANQARIPVTSALHKLPHLLKSRLTIGEAFATLDGLRRTGEYRERVIANWCADELAGVRAESSFYRKAIETYSSITTASGDQSAAELRIRCDQGLSAAFEHLNTEVHGLDNLPDNPGNVVIMNHLGCPAYYEFPNHYHFSFDTAFVSALLYQRYGRSPVRVVRQSPGVEHGHNLFYGKLGHITVPTVESGLEEHSQHELEDLRRNATQTLFDSGRAALGDGENVLICPEGSAQKANASPARFFSGAFRLALNANPEPYIVPIAIAGFERRYKEAKLVATVQEPFRLSEQLPDGKQENLRIFLDQYRRDFAFAVEAAQRLSRAADGVRPVEIDTTRSSAA